MRYLAIMLLLLPLCLHAQRREIGVNVGMCLPGRFMEGLEPVEGATFSLKALTMADRHLQVGLAFNRQRFGMRQVYYYTVNNEPELVYYYRFGKPLWSVTGLLHYRIPLRHHYFYLGPQGGYAASRVEQLDNPMNYRKGKGLVIGAQAGGVFAWGGGPLAVNFEFSPQYYLMTWSLTKPGRLGDTEGRNFWLWNLSVGLRFQF